MVSSILSKNKKGGIKMDMEYKPNSNLSKERAAKEEKKEKLKPVVSGPVKTKKKSGVHKFADIFISEDVSSVKSYIIMDVLVPAVKKAISDIVTNGIDMILYGGNGNGRKTTNASYVSYNRFSSKDDRSRSSVSDARERNGYSYDDILFNTRGDAEDVLAQMDAAIDKYGVVTVADMYDLANLTGRYTDQRYGWTSLRSAEIVRVRDGYVIKLPKSMVID